VLGAPWIDARTLAQYLNRRQLQAVRFVPIDFTPQKPYPCAGEVCHGVRVLVMDRNVLDAPELGVEIASALHRLYPDRFELEKMNTLLANRTVLDAIASGQDPQRVAEEWLPALSAFEEKRQKALLYGP
jgi:uncharacterized protein YbbC (DUF1343 family)